MTPLERAIQELEALVAGFGQGGALAPREGTKDWFLLRAYALGLSQLRRMKQLALDEEPAAAERFYRKASTTFKQLNVPDPVEVVRETLSGGGVLNG